jgi:RNA polymerase sigma-70 factor (ECF subfamily)
VERALVERAQRGDQAAFSEIAFRITPRLFGIARRILRDYQQAEDVTQQALVTIWRKLPRLADPDRFDGWAYRILVNDCYAEGRRKQQRAGELQLLDNDVATEDGALSISDRDMLRRAFGRVPPQQRAVLVLQYYLDLDHPAIAEMLGIPLGTVKSRASSGREALRAALEADARPAGLGRWTA